MRVNSPGRHRHRHFVFHYERYFSHIIITIIILAQYYLTLNKYKRISSPGMETIPAPQMPVRWLVCDGHITFATDPI